MKLFTGLPLIVLLSSLLDVTCRDVTNVEGGGFAAFVAQSRYERKTVNELQVPDSEERDVVPSSKASFASTKVAEIGAAAQATIGGISALAQNDWKNKTGEEIAWDVANAIVPLIGAALAFIPVAGPIISGVFLGMWGVISSLIGPKQENPMEKMITQVAEQLRKDVDKKLSNIIYQAINGEISRNHYICNKYAFISKSYSENFNKSIPLEISDALNVKIYLNDCDNFLKDTAEAFVYKDYADVLWVPSAITTSARLGFLAEIIKNGHLMGLTPEVILMYQQELRNDIKRQLNFYNEAVRLSSGKLKEIKRATSIEEAACTLQSQLLYFDTTLYPYGRPTVVNSTDMFATVKMSHYFKPINDSDNVKHLQLILNVTESNYPTDMPRHVKGVTPLVYMNCLVGPMYLRAPSVFLFNFYPMSQQNRYSYEFRVVYLNSWFNPRGSPDILVPVLAAVTKYSEFSAKYRQFQDKIKNFNSLYLMGTTLNIRFVNNNDNKFNDSVNLLDLESAVFWKKCIDDGTVPEFCDRTKAWIGRLLISSAGVFDHKYETLNPLIAIEEPTEELVYLLAVEVILRPNVK